MNDLYAEIAQAFQPEKKKKKVVDNKAKKIDDLLNKLNKLENMANLKDENTVKELTKIRDSLNKIKTGDVDKPNQLYTEKEIENDLVDEGSPLESGRYNGMNYAQMVAAALQAENEAEEITLALIEKSDNEEDIKKFVEIANDENDHSLVYQGILNRLNGLSE